MDLRQLRADISAVAQAAGFNSWDYMPDDPQDLPAAVVGGIKSMERLNRQVTQVQIGVTFYASAADPLDATSVIDRALSIGAAETSFIDLLDDVDVIADGPAWRSARFDHSSEYRLYGMPGGGNALGVEVTLEFTA